MDNILFVSGVDGEKKFPFREMIIKNVDTCSYEQVHIHINIRRTTVSPEPNSILSIIPNTILASHAL